jgi:hypothetical protein
VIELLASFFLACFVSARARAADFPALEHRLYISADEVRRADLRSLAAELVARLKSRCDEAGAAVGPSPLGGKHELVVMVPVGALESIAREGLRNQHETATTGGFRRPFERFEAEQQLAMLRLPYGTRGRALLPKYAVLRSAALGDQPLPARYGSVALVLKPEVEARATWTYADSLDFSRRAGLSELEGESNSVLPRTFSYRRRRGDENACVNYCEAQVWGPVTVADIAYAVVPEGSVVPGAFSRRVEIRFGPRTKTGAEPAVDDSGLRRGRAMADLDDASLIAQVDVSSGEDRARLIGELDERAPSPAVAAELDRLAASENPFDRELALYGLDAGSWKLFKPRLLQALRDPDPAVAIEAAALAEERRGDLDVVRALAEQRREVKFRPDSDRWAVGEWLDRLDARSLCPDRGR